MSLRGLVGGHEIVHSSCVFAAAEMYGCVAILMEACLVTLHELFVSVDASLLHVVD